MTYTGDRGGKDTEATSESTSALNGVKILAVDDLPNNLDVIKIILEAYGAEVKVAISVREALMTLHSVDIDVLVSDIQMPGENGYDLIRQVRQLPNKPSIPALALTASVAESDRQQAIRCGFQRYMTKPFEPIELVNIIAELKMRYNATREAKGNRQ
jgi:CheY-like chemotaxis protein